MKNSRLKNLPSIAKSMASTQNEKSEQGGEKLNKPKR